MDVHSMGIAVKGAIAVAAGLILLLLWVAAGRYISLFLDRVKTVRYLSLPTSPVTYDGTESRGTFRIGDVPLSTHDPYFKPTSLRWTGLFMLNSGEIRIDVFRLPQQPSFHAACDG
jgi:hypothetical protein